MSKYPNFSFLTYEGLPDLDPDDALAAELVRAKGIKVNAVIWDQADYDWQNAGICILRSTWDYHRKYSQFLSLLNKFERGLRLYNPPQLVRWNSHKGYLLDLMAKGLSVVPTRVLKAKSASQNEQNSDFDIDYDHLAELKQETGWQQIIIKPAVGLATSGVLKAELVEEESYNQANAHLKSLLKDGDVLIQPFLKSVHQYGERALVYINNSFSHAVRKSAFQTLQPAGLAGEVPAEASPEEIAFADRILASLASKLLYARVDLIQDDYGQPCLLELELVEPSLYLGMHPGAAKTFAEALIELASQEF